jgi:hypothetical protein
MKSAKGATLADQNNNDAAQLSYARRPGVEFRRRFEPDVAKAISDALSAANRKSSRISARWHRSGGVSGLIDPSGRVTSRAKASPKRAGASLKYLP